jgi:hypothetical protein
MVIFGGRSRHQVLGEELADQATSNSCDGTSIASEQTSSTSPLSQRSSSFWGSRTRHAFSSLEHGVATGAPHGRLDRRPPSTPASAAPSDQNKLPAHVDLAPSSRDAFNRHECQKPSGATASCS